MRVSIAMVARRQDPQRGPHGTMPIKIQTQPNSASAAGHAATSRTRIESVLAPISQRFILYYPALQRITGSANAALMLSQMLYWTRRYVDDHPERDGWFWHTARDWRKTTGLSRHEQDAARAYLRQCGCVEERLMGAPARMHYRVDLDALGKAIAQYAHRVFNAWHWSDRTTLALLGRPVAFLRGFADLTGSVTAALYLSELCQKLRTVERDAINGHFTLNGRDRELDAGNGWLDLPLGQSAEMLGVSEKRLRTARHIIKTMGIADESSSGGVQPRTLTRINLDQLSRLLSAKRQHLVRQPITAHDGDDFESDTADEAAETGEILQQTFDFAGMAYSYNPDLPKPANWNGGNVHSRPAETGKLDFPKPANKLAGFGTSVNEVSKQIGLPLQPPIASSPGVAAPIPAGSSGLPMAKEKATTLDLSAVVLPDNLRDDETVSACQMLATLPDTKLAQRVVDEWAAQLRLGRIRVPLSYLATLVSKAKQGAFVPAAGVDEAYRRERRQQLDEALAKARQVPAEMQAAQTPNAAAPRSGIPAFFREQLKTIGMQVKETKCTR